MSKAQREKIKAIKKGYEAKGMKEVKAPDGVWRPKVIGEVLEGEYLEREEDADSYHRNKYYFTDNGTLKDNGKPVGLNGRVAVFGSITLDERMSMIPIGANVAIIYCGEKVNPGYRKPTKLFTVMSDQEIEITEETSNPGKTGSVAAMPTDDPRARELIRDCKTFLDSEGKTNPSILEIAEYAEGIIEADETPDPELLDHVHIVLARDLIAECAISLTNDDNLSPTEEEVANCAKKLLKNNRGLLTKVQLLLAENVKSKKVKEEG